MRSDVSEEDDATTSRADADADADADDAASADGRRRRRGRNLEAVVDAMLALIREGNLRPASNEIAERAGLSPRSLFRYFEDIDDLCRIAIARQQARLKPHLPIETSPAAPLPERIAAFVEQRVRLFETMGRVGEVARLRAPFQPLIAAELGEVRTHLRQQIGRLFAEELGRTGGASRLAAIDALCSFEAYQLLRRDQALSRARAAAVLSDALTTLLGGDSAR